MFPLTCPKAAGLKVTRTGMLLPAAKVNGSFRLLTAKPALAFTVETVTAVDPVFVRVAAKVIVCPTTTLGK